MKTSLRVLTLLTMSGYILILCTGCGASFRAADLESHSTSASVQAAITAASDGAQTLVNSESEALADVAVFDPEFYLSYNADLKKAGLTTPAQAKSHWLSNGIAEGRRSKNNFSVRDYLGLNADLIKAYGSNSRDAHVRALQHYLSHGRKEGRRTISSNSVYNFAIDKDRAEVGNEIVQIKTHKAYGGSVFSMKLRGREIANFTDSGRLIQPAIFLDNTGGCQNPTEGGAMGEQLLNAKGENVSGTNSSSVLKSVNMGPGILYTETQAANWFYANSPKFSAAFNPTAECDAIPYGLGKLGPAVSDTSFSKYIQVGFDGNPNLIFWQTTVKLSKPRWAMAVDVPTGYHTALMSQYDYVDLTDNGNLKSLPPVDGWTLESEAATGLYSYNYFPMIQSTPDGSSAVGMIGMDFDMGSMYKGSGPSTPAQIDAYSRITPAQNFGWVSVDPNESEASKASPVSMSTAKWATRYVHGAVPAGEYNYMVFIAVGTRSEVHKTLWELSQKRLNGNLATVLTRMAIGTKGFDPKFYAQTYSSFSNPSAFTVPGKGTFTPKGDPSGASIGSRIWSFILSDLMVYGAAYQGRLSANNFSPADYLKRNPDVQTYCGRAGYACGLKHWIIAGIAEGRSGAPIRPAK